MENVTGIGGIFFRSDDRQALAAWYRERLGVDVQIGELEQHENGKFAWILDPEGHMIELWEPVDPEVDPYLP